MEKKRLEEVSKEYALKIAKAKGWREKDKIIGELLEKLTRFILYEKGHFPEDHKVSDRRHPDIHCAGFIMEIANTKKYRKNGKLVQYHENRIRTALGHFDGCGYRDKYYLVSFKSALEPCKKELQKRNVKIMEIGSQVIPENLVQIYPKARKLIDKYIQDREPDPKIIILGEDVE